MGGAVLLHVQAGAGRPTHNRQGQPRREGLYLYQKDEQPGDAQKL